MFRISWVAAAAVAACGAVAWFPASIRAQSDHSLTAEDIQLGSRLYTAQCATCHGATGDTVAGVNLRRGQFRRPMSDDDLRQTITTGVPDAGMPPFAFQPGELTGLVAYIRAGFDVGNVPVRLGDASRGRTLFEGKGQCATCHRVAGKGPRTAPDLSEIGTVRNPQQLSRTLNDPTSQMMPINRPVQIVMKDGKAYKGRRLNEDTYTVQMIDDQERLLSLDKSDIRTLDVSRTSTMPPASRTLGPDEIADVLAYLVSLKGGVR
jgi:putative heme-binding domain-containing protein